MPSIWELASKTNGRSLVRSGRAYCPLSPRKAIEVQAIAPALLADSLRVLAQVALLEAASASVAAAGRADPLLLVLPVAAKAQGPVEDCGERRVGEDSLHLGGEKGALPEEGGRAGEDVAEDVCNEWLGSGSKGVASCPKGMG